MPMYDFRCSRCGHVTALVVKIDQRNKTYPCDRCTGQMERIEVCAPRVVTDYAGYESPATGKWVEGRKAHREDLARSGCRVREPGETEAFIRDRTRLRDERLDKILDTALRAEAAKGGLNA